MSEVICNHHRDERRACSCVETFHAIVQGEDIPKADAYCAIVREAAKQGVIQCFWSDLITHDRADLQGYSGPFLWIMRESGTYVRKPSTEKGRLTPQGIVAAFGIANTWFYWWDGTSLKRVTFERACELLAIADEREERKSRAA